MTTKIISKYSDHEPEEIEGTIDDPKIVELSHSEIHHISIADHGVLAVFTDSHAIHIGRRDYISVVLDEEHPVLDLKERGITSDCDGQRFEFTRGGKERS